MKGLTYIKQIDSAALDYLSEQGLLKGVTVTSRNKHSRAKRHYVKDELAFLAWEALNYDPSDPEYHRWKSKRNKKGRK